MSQAYRIPGSEVLSRCLSRLEMLSEEAYAYLLLTPPLLILGAVAFWPLLETFRMSLYADGRGSARLGEFVGFENYVNILTGSDPFLPRQLVDITFTGVFPFIEMGSPFFRQALFVTLAFAILSVIFETLIGFGQAYVMAKDYRGRRWVRVAIILPWSIPIVIQGMIFYLMFQPTVGFASEPLQAIGLFSESPLSNTVDSFVIVLVADIWKTSAFMGLLILAGLQSIDKSLYDVAKVSGASPWQRFKLITLPLVMPALLVAMLFRTLNAMRVFGLIDVVSSCSQLPSLSCLVVTSMFDARLYASAATVAFITAAIIGLLVIVYIVLFRNTEGGAHS
jgi:multiple sugar transport system permease protein